MTIADRLREPLLRDVEMNGVQRLSAHRAILERKRMIRDVFVENHRLMRDLDERLLSGAGVRLEVGAGVFPVRESFPDVIATDIVAAPHIDKVLDAQNMDLPSASIRAIYGQHTFHHLPEPELFFEQLRRVLAPGGGAILIEPYYGPIATFMFKRMFSEEDFDKAAPSWKTDVDGVMTGANQALSFIVFERDSARYAELYPDLPIVYRAPISNHLRYLLSGGLNFRQLLPDISIPVLEVAEKLLQPLNRMIALHHVVVIRKM